MDRDKQNDYVSDAALVRLNILYLAANMVYANNGGPSEVLILADEFLDFVKD